MARPAFARGVDIDLDIDTAVALELPADYQQESRGYGDFEREIHTDVGTTAISETVLKDGNAKDIDEADAASLAAHYKEWLERYPGFDRASQDESDKGSIYNQLLSPQPIEWSKMYVDIIRRCQWEFLTGCLRESAGELGVLLEKQLELTLEMKKVIEFKQRTWLSFPADHVVWDERKRVQARIDEKESMIQALKEDLEALSQERDLWFELDRTLSDGDKARILARNEDHSWRFTSDWMGRAL